jgi:hypothetical protein
MAAVAAVGLLFAMQRGDATAIDLLAVGWIIYLVEEHLVHRFIFHADLPRRQSAFNTMYRLHFGHHDQAWNKHLLFTPLWFALPLSAVSCAVVSLFLGPQDAVIAILGGGIPAYLFFEWLHLTSHFKSSSKGRLGRYITRRHSKHHHIDYGKWFTISPGGQLVDKTFGTDPAHYSVVANVRTCGLAADDPRLVESRIRFGTDSSLANRQPTIQGVELEHSA